MTIHINSKLPAEWSDIDRLRPIELLDEAASVDEAFSYVRETIMLTAPLEVDSIMVLIEALESVGSDDHALYLRNGIKAILVDEDLREAIWLGLAIKRIPGAAAEVAQIYAKLAHQLTRFVSSRVPSTPAEHSVAVRLRDRIRRAMVACVGWSVVAAGVRRTWPSVSRGACIDALNLGAKIEDCGQSAPSEDL